MRATSCAFFGSMPFHSSSAVEAAASLAALAALASGVLLGALTLRLTERALVAAQQSRASSSCEGVRGSASEAASAMKPTSEAGAPDTGRVMLGSVARPFALSESKKGCHSGGTSPQHRHTKKSLR